MKKTIVYILVVSALVLALGGCGSTMNDGMIDNAIHVTPRPEVTMKPEVTSMPEVNNGVVNDDDGVITEGDNGPMETREPVSPKPKHTATPKPSATAVP